MTIAVDWEVKNQTKPKHNTVNSFAPQIECYKGTALYLNVTDGVLVNVLDNKNILYSCFSFTFFFSKYSVGRTTHNLKVKYFVKQDFSSNFAGELRRIERQVEEEYVSNLRTNCWKERSYSEY